MTTAWRSYQAKNAVIAHVKVMKKKEHGGVCVVWPMLSTTVDRFDESSRRTLPRRGAIAHQPPHGVVGLAEAIGS